MTVNLDPSTFDNFVADYDKPGFRARVAKKSGLDRADVDHRLDIYFSEMRFGFQFVSARLHENDSRVLEVGAGLGLLSLFLARSGYEVVALEPAATGFDFFAATREVVMEDHAQLPITFLTCGAEALGDQDVGPFDFAFSINVMEHIAELDKAVAAVIAKLRPGGVWSNTCPNYWFPYEPHYAIPMVPFAPGLTRRLMASRIEAAPNTWDSLNFISAGKVRALAKKNGVKVSFEPALLYTALVRIGHDADFAERHAHSVAGRAYRTMQGLRLLSLLRLLPYWAATPMNFTFAKPETRA